MPSKHPLPTKNFILHSILTYPCSPGTTDLWATRQSCSHLLWQLGSHGSHSPECPLPFYLWKLHSVFKALLKSHLPCKPSSRTRPLTLGRKSGSLMCLHGSLLRPMVRLEIRHRSLLRAWPPPPRGRQLFR